MLNFGIVTFTLSFATSFVLYQLKSTKMTTFFESWQFEKKKQGLKKMEKINVDETT